MPKARVGQLTLQDPRQKPVSTTRSGNVMGWYTVTKRIKGNAYLYRQRSWREGGRVRTESHYIGPAGDNAATASEFNRERVDAVEAALKRARVKRDEQLAAAAGLEELAKKEPPSLRQSPSPRLKPENTTASGNGKDKQRPQEDAENPKEKMLKDRLERHDITHRSLKAEHQRFLKQLSANRIDTIYVPRVVVDFPAQGWIYCIAAAPADAGA